MPLVREVGHTTVKTMKNFITGQEAKVSMFKPNLFPAKAVFTVELFDAESGELIEKQVSENRLSAYIVNLIFRQFFIEMFCKGYCANIGSDKSLKYLYNFFGGGDSYDNVFRVMLLTNNQTILEDVYDKYTWGKPLGYADLFTAYAGSNNSRGTINLTETNITRANGKFIKHFVVDFPTNAANGTFQSIYITGGNGGDAGVSGGSYGSTAYAPKYNLLTTPNDDWNTWNSQLLDTFPIVNTGTEDSPRSPDGSNHYVDFCFTPDTIYEYFVTGSSRYTPTNASYGVLIENRKLYPMDRATKTILSPITLPDDFTFIHYDGTYFYGLKQDGSIKKMDGAFNIIASIALPGQCPDGLRNDYRYGVSYNDIYIDNQYIYLLFVGPTTNNSSDYLGQLKVCVMTKTGVFVRMITLSTTLYQNDQTYIGGGYVFHMLPNNILAITDYYGSIWWLNVKDWTFYQYGGNMGGNASFQRDIYTDQWFSYQWDLGKPDANTGRQYRYWACNRVPIPAVAHTLLSSPVTKTSANTMKIQYDLVVDDIKYFDHL